MAPRETENNAYAKFWGDKQRTLWYVMVFLEWSISLPRSRFLDVTQRSPKRSNLIIITARALKVQSSTRQFLRDIFLPYIFKNLYLPKIVLRNLS